MEAEELRHDAPLAETRCGRESLPDWHQLLAAFRGEVGWSPGDHLIACWAKAFANLHRGRRLSSRRAVEIDCRRAQVVTLVDQWTERYVIAPSRRLSPTQSVGAAVDEIAAAYVAAEYCLMAAEDVADDAVHAAWSRVAELACRWNDLIANNPGPWHPSGADGQE
ncbi:DUF4254 domain-containing protein [Nocardia sp. CS682]|uniref:DUF4254 domain-containing protein n=1 Tax=Nocardia sp. CS682 TaxID=1047172 RepID=UPI001074B314|nr:DUF4254 domain-containing protein [Nocardia sp. CS682]